MRLFGLDLKLSDAGLWEGVGVLAFGFPDPPGGSRQ